MAKLLLNYRESRITVAGGLLLLPAEVKKDERKGRLITPSKTLISERPAKDGSSAFDRVQGCRQTRKLFEAGIIAWSGERVEEEPGPEGEEQTGAEAAMPMPQFERLLQAEKAERDAQLEAEIERRVQERVRQAEERIAAAQKRAEEATAPREPQEQPGDAATSAKAEDGGEAEAPTERGDSPPPAREGKSGGRGAGGKASGAGKAGKSSPTLAAGELTAASPAPSPAEPAGPVRAG